MIKTFKNRSLKRLFEKDDRSKIRSDHIERVENILAYLDYSEKPADMNLKGLELHQLKGKLQGFWSVSVSGNYRIWFRFEDNNVFDIGYGDYH